MYKMFNTPPFLFLFTACVTWLLTYWPSSAEKPTLPPATLRRSSAPWALRPTRRNSRKSSLSSMESRSMSWSRKVSNCLLFPHVALFLFSVKGWVFVIVKWKCIFVSGREKLSSMPAGGGAAAPAAAAEAAPAAEEKKGMFSASSRCKF